MLKNCQKFLIISEQNYQMVWRRRDGCLGTNPKYYSFLERPLIVEHSILSQVMKSPLTTIQLSF